VTAIAHTPTVENLTLNIANEIHVRASLEATFEALLEQMGPANENPEGTPLPMVIEPSPGGRWFRDLGNDNGHFWGHVQAIKRPTLLEITGPLFMSAAVISNVQYRLKEVDGGTLISFRHSAFGFVPDGYREGVSRGWLTLLDRVRQQAEGGRKTH
jgi:uncharacterized protein YndB with AHSA1/START domain